MIQLTQEELKQIIIDAFNEGLKYDNLIFDYPAERYASFILNKLPQKSGVND